ncbi:hypothetical protein [Halorarum salinum]|uniref:hypothetical protein n=1 Tax=Halorarum salinum TaxID=2743089 RepID=UPI001C531F5D|nr:hypothetical protein [Halobaculum salinum]
MPTHVSPEQVRRWIDDGAVREVTEHDDEATEFNFELTLSRLPVHVIKEETWGPLRVVGKTGFDADRVRALLRDDDDRQILLQRLGPMLAATPGFYTFLDGEGNGCAFRNAESMQTEYRIYPDEASQQALMDGLMATASGMRYVRNTLAAMLPNRVPAETEANLDAVVEDESDRDESTRDDSAEDAAAEDEAGEEG